MLKNGSVFLFLFSFSFHLKAVDVSLGGDEPDYKNLQTIVRFNRSEGVNSGFCKDYKGLELMFETGSMHDLQWRIAWAGILNFKPCGEPSKISEQESRVSLNYLTRPDYFKSHRGYGEQTDFGHPIGSAPGADFQVYQTTTLYRDAGTNQEMNSHKRWLENSLLEWRLHHAWTVSDVIKAVNQMRIPPKEKEKKPQTEEKKEEKKKFPKYFLYGYSPDGGCLNCVTFPTAFLETIGINFKGSSPYISSYTEHYLEQTAWGKAMGYVKKGTMGAGVLAGGLEGAVLGARLGASLGPIGIVGGASIGAIGGSLCGYMGGFAVQKAVCLQSPVRKAARPEDFIAEMYRHRNTLEARVVRTSDTGSQNSRIETAMVGLFNGTNYEKNLGKDLSKGGEEHGPYVDYVFSLTKVDKVGEVDRVDNGNNREY